MNDDQRRLIRPSRPARLKLIGAMLLILAMTFSCKLIETPLDKAIDAVDRLSALLERNSDDWEAIAERVLDELPVEARSLIDHEVNNVIQRGIAASGVEFRCDVDFLRNRVREDLYRLKAELLHRKGVNVQAPARTPVFCHTVPEVVEPGTSWLTFYGDDFDAAEVQVLAADGPAERRRVSYPVTPEGAKIAAATPKTGNYHWVFARSESEAEVRVASTAWYFPNPGEAPTELLRAVKHELEVVPDPLPREHSGYRESEKWRFLVRYQGQPLAAQPVVLETEFGSRVTALTDAAGLATLVFPRDFKPAQGAGGGEEGHGPRRARFVVATEKEDGGKRYLTAFNYAYGQDADRGRSLGWGAAFGVLGMAAATPLLRRRANGANGGNGNEGAKDHA